MREMMYVDALNEALREEMVRDETVFVMGEDVELGYIFGVSKGLVKEFGAERVRDTPISENALVGMGLGAALTGMRPVVEIMFANLLALCMDQIVNETAMIRYYTGGQVKKIPLVVRVPIGVWRGYGSTHSSSLESWFMHTPGLKVAVPATPADAKGLLKTAIRDDNPVIFFENKLLYRVKGPVPDGEHLVPFGEADIKRRGSDVTILAYSMMLHRALAAAEKLYREGVNVEVVDPRTLVPLDMKTVIDSVRRTGRLIIAEEDCKTGGVGAEIAARVVEEAFDLLDAPILRVAALDVHVPTCPTLEDVVLPTEDKIINAVKKVVG